MTALLLSLAARGFVLSALALLAVILMRRASAASRHLVLLSAVAGLLLLPIVSQVGPAWPVRVLPATSPTQVLPAVDMPPLSAGRMPPAVAVRTFGLPKAVRPSSASSGFLIPIWMIGSLFFAARLLVSIGKLRAFSCRCPVVTDGPLREKVMNLVVQSGVRVTLRRGNAQSVPMTWGWRRPILLLPAGAEDWPEERLRAVVLHETAHIARRDWLTQCLTQCVCAAYWYDPLVWLLARRMAREAEHACDDRVLLAGIAGPEYAQQLLDAARQARALRNANGLSLTGNSPMVDGKIFEGGLMMASTRSPIPARLNAILETTRSRRQATRRALAAALALTALILLPLAAVRLAARAEASAPASPDDLIDRATNLSWRGQWAADSVLARQVLANRRATAAQKTLARWLLAEAAFWQEHPAEFRTLAAQYFAQNKLASPVDANASMMKAMQSLPNPGKFSDGDLFSWAYSSLSHHSYGDALHAARCLLNRKNVRPYMRAVTWIIVASAAQQNGFSDTLAEAKREGEREIARLPSADRAPLEKSMREITTITLTSVNPISDTDWARIAASGPQNLTDAAKRFGLTPASENGPVTNYAKLYAEGTDSGPQAGSQSVWVAARNKPLTDGIVLSQKFRAGALQGKRVRFSGWLKTQNADGAGVFLHIDSPHLVLVWNMMDTPVRGTTAWKRYEFVADVPTDAQGLIFGFDSAGRGRVWASGFQFEVVSLDVPMSHPSNRFDIKP